MQQPGSKYFARRPPPILGMGSIGQNSFFQNRGILHIKLNGITKCSNMVANILSADPSPPPLALVVDRSKFNFFRTMSCCISNLRECSNMIANSLSAAPPPPPPEPRAGLNIFIHIFIYIVIYKYTVYNTIMKGFRKKSNDLYKSVSL